jgi:hypothetical protein
MDTGSRGPAPGGRGRSGWAAARGCAGLWPGCGACPRLGFAARGRCGPSPGVLLGRIYFRQGWGVGGGPSPAPAGRVSGARRSARPSVAAWPPARGVCSSRGGGGASDSRALPEAFVRYVLYSVICSAQDAASVTPIRHLRPAGSGVCTSRQSAICGRHPSRHSDVGGRRPYSRRGDGTSDSKTLPEYSRDPHAMDCKEWWASQTFLTRQSRQGQPPPLQCHVCFTY